MRREEMTAPKKERGTSELSSECERLFATASVRGNVRLKLSIENQDWIAIEGDEVSLTFLGEILSNFARQNGPECLILDSPEARVFKEGSLGICIYRRPRAPE